MKWLWLVFIFEVIILSIYNFLISSISSVKYYNTNCVYKMLLEIKKSFSLKFHI